MSKTCRLHALHFFRHLIHNCLPGLVDAVAAVPLTQLNTGLLSAYSSGYGLALAIGPNRKTSMVERVLITSFVHKQLVQTHT